MNSNGREAPKKTKKTQIFDFRKFVFFFVVSHCFIHNVMLANVV